MTQNNKTKIDVVTKQLQELHEEYLQLNEIREISIKVEINIPVRIALTWDSGMECFIEVYDSEYKAALNALVEEQTEKTEKAEKDFNKKIRRFGVKCEIAAEELGVDDLKYWDAVIDNDVNKVIAMMYAEMS